MASDGDERGRCCVAVRGHGTAARRPGMGQGSAVGKSGRGGGRPGRG
jgi:hypothetical protein